MTALWAVSAIRHNFAEYWTGLLAESDAAKRATLLHALRSQVETPYGEYPSGW
jgi:hypothetical protein